MRASLAPASQPSASLVARTAVPRLTVLAGACALACLSVAHAQQPPNAGSQLQQQGAQPPATPRAQPNVLPSGFTPQPVLEKLPAASVAVKSFKFTGNSLFSGDQLAALVADKAGKTLSFDELNEAATTIRQYYRGQGYFLAQAYLPRQDVTGGVIEITVLEGYIGKVSANAAANARLRASFAQGILEAHLKPGQLITETGLERPLLLINDTPGATIKSQIGPGAGVGTADLDAQIGQNEGESFISKATNGVITGGVDLDNYGNRFTGQWRAGASMSVNNLTGFGDLLSFRGQIALENRKTNFGRVAWQTPIWYYGTKVGISYSKLNYSLIKDFAPAKLDGEGEIASLFAYHPIIRTRNLNVILNVGIDGKSLEDRNGITTTTSNRKINLSHIGVQGDWRDSLVGGGLNSYGLTFSRGNLKIRQAIDVATDQAATGTQTIGNFGKTNFEFQRLQKITDNLNLLAAINGQFATKNLASAEKIALGGPGGVLAFPTGEAAGDEGFQGTFELRYGNPAWTFAGASLVLSGFYDYGHVTINKVNRSPVPVVNNRTLQGTGFGVNLGKEGDYLLVCNEYCGTSHHNMAGVIHVSAKAAAPPPPPPKAAALPGRDVIETYACIACHSIDGSLQTGPTFKGLYGSKRVLRDGSTAVADDAYLRESIEKPEAKIVEGFEPNMPEMPLSPAEVQSIIDYLKTLK